MAGGEKKVDSPPRGCAAKKRWDNFPHDQADREM